MQILIRYSRVLPALAALLFFACSSSRPPLTPEEAFGALKKAYAAENPRAVASLLSAKSRACIRDIIAMAMSLDERRLRTLASRIGVDPAELGGLTPESYIALQMKLAKQMNDDAVRHALSCDIIEIKRDGNRASVRVDNGMELPFVKEGPYWKFDLDW